MKEIKLQFWNRKSKTMSVPYSLADLAYEGFPNQYKNEHEDVLDEECDVLQFTGLKDKNGKEIYEGDIVRILYSDWVSQSDYSITLEQHKINKSYVGTVVFEDGKYLLQFDGYTDTLHHGVHGERHIIGNIYENPNLLQDSTKGVTV